MKRIARVSKSNRPNDNDIKSNKDIDTYTADRDSALKPPPGHSHSAEVYQAADAVLDAIDWQHAEFPSNRRTFQQIRSHVITTRKEGRRSPEEIGEVLEALGNAERDVLFRGVLRGLGYRPTRVSFDPGDDASEYLLSGIYRETGVARGRHEATRLVEQLSKWAADQARKHTPGRSR
jgi:hypothetical protein